MTATPATIISAIEARMRNGEPFTYADLRAARHGLGRGEGDDRLADKTIQKWRRAGWISFVRIGKLTLWALTEEGRRANDL